MVEALLIIFALLFLSYLTMVVGLIMDEGVVALFGLFGLAIFGFIALLMAVF